MKCIQQELQNVKDNAYEIIRQLIKTENGFQNEGNKSINELFLRKFNA